MTRLVAIVVAILTIAGILATQPANATQAAAQEEVRAMVNRIGNASRFFKQGSGGCVCA
jgi:hypothetical protein